MIVGRELVAPPQESHPVFDHMGLRHQNSLDPLIYYKSHTAYRYSVHILCKVTLSCVVSTISSAVLLAEVGKYGCHYFITQ